MVKCDLKVKSEEAKVKSKRHKWKVKGLLDAANWRIIRWQLPEKPEPESYFESHFDSHCECEVRPSERFDATWPAA